MLAGAPRQHDVKGEQFPFCSDKGLHVGSVFWVSVGGWGADGWRGWRGGVDAITEMLCGGVGVGVGGSVIGQLGFLFQYVVKHESPLAFLFCRSGY